MSDYVTNCFFCDKMIALDDEMYEIRNQWGLPVSSCELCWHQESEERKVPRGCHPNKDA